MVQLSHPYMTTGKTIALTNMDLVGVTTLLTQLTFKSLNEVGIRHQFHLIAEQTEAQSS